MNKDILIQLQNFEDDYAIDEMLENEVEELKLKKSEKLVLLNQLLKEFTNEQLDILSCLIENEIKSDVSYLDDVSGKEKEFYKSHILKLKDMLIQITNKPDLPIKEMII